MTAFLLEAPTDAQLAYIRDLCERHSLAPPEAVASRQEASAVIGAILDGSYDPDEYALPWGVPFR